MTDQQIRQLINDPEKGLNSDLKKLQTMLKDHGIITTQKKIKEIRDKQNWYQLTKKVKKQKHFNSIMVPGNSILYYMDVIVYNRFKIHGYQYILNVVDTNSRYVASRALTNMKLKESTRGNKAFTLLDAVKEIMEEMGYPKELRCDNQFISDDFVKLMKENNVKVIYSETDDLIKNSLVESFNRTLAGLFQNWRVSTGRTEWYKILPMIIKKYNNTIHSTINAKPADVWSGKDINRQEMKRVVSKFTVGDKVRIKKFLKKEIP